MKEYYRTGTSWENKFAYSRAVKRGNIIEISGTTSVKDGKLVHQGDVYQQTIRIFEIFKESLEFFNASLDDIVRTRMYVRNIEDYELVAKAHGEVMKGIDPATTLVGDIQFIDSEMLVEIEATAILG